jgi:SAM-dependent MidA family methyltransferase
MSSPGARSAAGGESDPFLLELLRERIARQGPLPFPEFMQIALYQEGRGYYARPEDPVGRDGDRDYYTAPSRHPGFGLLLGRQVAECLGKIGGERLELVEAGPGSGDLIVSVLEALRKSRDGRPRELQGTLVEPNPARAAAQRRRLAEAGWERGLRWLAPVAWEDSPEPIHGCVLANEVLDAMPVHRLVFRGGELREIYVDWKDSLVEVQGPVSSPEIPALLGRQGFAPREGQEVEVGLEALRWIRRVGKKLERGYLILADYGHAAPEIHSPRHQRGTLMAYHRHRASEEYLIRVGRQDLTAHVNFTSVLEAAAEAGLTASTIVSQGRFLLALGALDLMPDPAGSFDWREYGNRKAFQELFVPGGMGESHKILVLASRGLDLDLIGLRPPEHWSIPRPGECSGAGLEEGAARNGT